MREDDRDRVSRQGTEAWRRLKKEKNWTDWRQVGEAFQVGREWAMNQAQSNKPEGKAYNMAFSEWMLRYKMDDMDKGDRSRLFKVMAALPLIEQWRATLTMTERLKLNHPNAVLRKFEKAFEIPDPSKPVKPGLRDAVAELSEENIKLKTENAALVAHVEEIEAAGTSDKKPKAKSRKASTFDKSLPVIKQAGALHHEMMSWADSYCGTVEAWRVAHPALDEEAKICVMQALELSAMRLQKLAQAFDGR
jgi:hypothetical protein